MPPVATRSDASRSRSSSWSCRRSPTRRWSPGDCRDPGGGRRARPAFLESLKDHLRHRELLLVLDNFEHVPDAAPAVLDLLEAAPRVNVLVISRAVLHLYGERQIPVPPLLLPDPAHLPDLTSLSQYEAVALFVERAAAVKPDFA